jgi:hypothetical protein
MKIKTALLFLSLIAIALGLGIALWPAEKRLDGIPRPTDKDHNPSELFHIARTPAEKALDEIIRRAIKDDNIFEYVLGRPWYDAKKDTGYSRLFTKQFVRAVTKIESDAVKESCGGQYGDDICGIDYNPIFCGQDYSESGYLYRTVDDDGRKAKILSLGVDFPSEEIQTSYRLIKDGGDWKLDGVICGVGGGFNRDCSNSLCAEDIPALRKKAELGDADAQYSLGVMYKFSWGVVKWDEAESAKWYRKAAEQGHAAAQLYAPYDDRDESDKWLLHKAAEQGHADSQYALGNRYEEGRIETKDYAQAAKWYRKAAEQGQIEALSSLGPMYEEGRGVTQDYAESAKWYRKAAELGSANAQYKLGMMYYTGRGVKQDQAEAEKWFRMAAERKKRDAQYQLWIMYSVGRSVKPDQAEAEKWLRKAAERGHDEAKQELDKREIEKLRRR